MFLAMIRASRDGQEIALSVTRQRDFFADGATRDYGFRLESLKRLAAVITRYEKAILAALAEDLGKPPFEAYAGEYLVAMNEVKCAIRGLKAWMRPRRVPTSILHFPGRSYVVPEPLGVVAIISPWNFPFQLALAPLIAAVAAGNCIALKPSESSPATSALIADLVSGCFPAEHICVYAGGPETAAALVGSGVDYVFFTGGSKVGSQIAIECARRSIPAALELGGKNPCVVLPDADLGLAVRRIAWGKFFNCGQSCVAPDYLLVPRGRKDEVVDLFRRTLDAFYGRDARRSGDYGRIINRANLERLRAFLPGTRILLGGESDPDENFMAPTLVEAEDRGHAVWSEEIFGPILPIREYSDREEASEWIAGKPAPMAAYVFGRQPDAERGWAERIRCGSLVFNDTIAQFLSTSLPFGGFGASGNVKYHGRHGFLAFSHQRGIFRKSLWMDLRLRYPPYGLNLKWLRLLGKLG
jgi:aldehyde dehydrogenase (NAD+)